jgi:hypothetical protein
MKQSAGKPKRLYKYKKFDQQTLELLVLDKLHFSDPRKFNDPFDTRPSVDVDLGEDRLEKALRCLVEQRVHAEMGAAAKTIKYKGPRTQAHIQQLSKLSADRIIEKISFDATDREYDLDEPYRYLLGRYLERELLKRYDKGVVSLSRKMKCPLMWSHYADQHRGICIGYSIPQGFRGKLLPVEYGGTRRVAASDISAMLEGHQDARDRVDRAVLLRKANPWKYEREWRLIGDRGLQDSCLELEEVIFGFRCDSVTRYAVVRAMENRDRPIKYYEVCEVNGTFELAKHKLDSSEDFACLPRRSVPIEDLFEEVEQPDI